jgi:mannose-1-phosphate guanylyltransferase
MIAQVRPFPQREPHARAAARHLWGIVVAGSPSDPPGTSGGPLGPRHAGTGVARPSLFRQTLDRAVRLIAPQRLLAVLAREHVAAYDGELLDIPEIQRVVQPAYRGTAAAVYLPLLKIAREDPEAVIVVLPGNHLVDHGARFMSYVAKAAGAAVARPDLPVVIGAHPRTPDPSQAWIEPGDPVDGLEPCGIRAIRRFLPHPTRADLEALFNGNGLLSTFVIIAKARTLIDLGRRQLPEVLETLEPLEHAFGGPEEALLSDAVYECMPIASLAGQLLERWQEFAVLPIPDVMWRDSTRPLGPSCDRGVYALAS